MAPTPLSQIPTVQSLYTNHTLQPSASPTSTATSRYTSLISLIRADITTLSVSAIVNAANESLLGGGGVDGSIHRAAGPGLLAECRKLGGCRTGSAKISGAYDLPCDKVIHAVGPIYGSNKRRNEEMLAGCYTSSLDLAVENGCKSIAFSAISTGVYGYPSTEAAEVAVRAVKGWLEANEEEGRTGRLERVVFCSFLQKDEDAYWRTLPRYFTPDKDEGSSTGAVDEADGNAFPALPDPPTKEPKEEGQPESKRPKFGTD